MQPSFTIDPVSVCHFVGNAMLLCSMLPYALSAAAYFGIYRAFPIDKAQVLQDQLSENTADEPELVHGSAYDNAYELKGLNTEGDELKMYDNL